jgi:hypothetical protein
MSDGGNWQTLGNSPWASSPEDGKWVDFKAMELLGVKIQPEEAHSAQLNVVVKARGLGYSNVDNKMLLEMLGIDGIWGREEMTTMILRVIERDPTLPHQIIIQAGRNVSEAGVSCNCMLIASGSYKTMGFVPFGEGTSDELMSIYKNPDNHNPHFVRFDPADRPEKITVEVQ